MRTIDQLSKEIKDEEVVHGPNSEIVGKLKSLLGLAWLDEDLDTGINLLYEASAIFHHMEQQYPETELDVDYRLANTLELRATVDEQVEEAKKIMAHVHEKRKELDADKNRSIPEQPFAAEDEELDSTLIYFDEAMILQQSGNLVEAEALFEKCLQLRYPKFGAIAAANVNTLLSYSDLLREIGKFYKAEDILNLALKSSVVGRSRINLKTAEVLNALGNLQRVRAEFDKAEESLKEALNIRKEILTEKNVQVAATLNNIAELKRERGDNIAAVEYHLKSIQVFELVGGPSHPGTINAKGNYGITLQRLARLSDGEGFENVNNAMEYMYSNGYEDKHPWLTKFSNETILTEARRSAAANNFEFSVERYDTAIARKVASHDIHQTTRKLDEMSEIDRLQLRELERERFVVLLSWCESCLVKCKFQTAADLLRKCEVFVTAHLSIGTSKREEVFWLAQFHLAHAKYARAMGRYTEALERAQQAAVLIENQREESHLFYISIQQFVAHLHIEWARYSDVRDVLNRINKLLKIRVGKDSGTFGKAPLTVTLALLRAQHVEALYGLHIGAFDLTQTKLAEMEAIIQGHTLLDHEVYGEYMLLRAKLERVRGSHEVVVRSLEQAQLSVASHYGKEHMMYVEILQESAACGTLQGTYSAALNAIDEAQHLVQNMMPPESTHPLILWGQVTRGQVLHGVDRLREARDVLDQTAQRSAKIFADHPHPIGAHALEGLGSVYADLYDFKMAKEHHEAALLRWQLLFPTDTEHLYAKASCKYARCLAQVKHGRPTPAVLDAVGVAIEFIRSSTAKLRSDAASVVLADLLALKARILFEQGEWDTASQTIGEAGAQLRSYLHTFDSPKTYEMLLLHAQITSALGKHRDAKVQISFAFARLQLIFGPMLPTHRKLLDVYLVAAENMRQVGYFFDAMECIDIVEEKVAKKFGVTSVEMLRISFVHALIQRDLRRLAKAEQRFMEMEERIRSVYGVASKVYFDWKFQLAKCLTMQNKQSRAMSLLQELLGEVDGLLGPAPWIKTLLVNDLCYQALILKPQEQQTAMYRLKEEVLPLVSKVCGSNSLLGYHVRGRIALFMNSLKKDSGRKPLFEALKGMDDLKPFNLPYDHPFVLELGGYEKPSSKDRVSKNVQEDAFYAWALLDTTAENAADFLPKSLFVDVDNNDPTIWGSVHYYGVELFNQSNVVHGGRRGRSAHRGGGGGGRGTRSRSPSPSGGDGSTTKPTRTKSSGQVQSLVRDNESLEDALLREHKARKELEDELVVLKHEKANVEEALDAERVETQKLTKVVDEHVKTNEALQAQVATLAVDMQRVQQQLQEVQAELQRRIELEEEALRRKQEEEEIALAEAKRREEEAAYLADHPELIQPEDNPLYKTDLEAASFLFQRAQNLYERGWYNKAQPLFEESCTIRERILTIAKRTTMDTIRAKVLNLIAMSEFVSADAALHRIQQQEAAMHGVESEYSLQLSLDAAQSKIYQGFYPQAMEILDASAKVLSLKSANTGEPSRIINQLFGQCLTMQGALSLQQGRINEAKALIERGQALISRALGVNNLQFVESLLVKTELLITIGKGKEAVNLLDQTIVTVKSLVKTAEEIAREKETVTSGAAKKDEVVVGGTTTSTASVTGSTATATTTAAAAAKKAPATEYDHPLVAQCLLLYARAAFAMSRFTEAKRRFQAARAQYLKFYEHIDCRLFPLALYEARMHLEMCDYREARVSLTSTVTVIEQAVAQYEDFIPTPFALGHCYALLASLEVATGHFETARSWIKQVALTLKALPTSIPIVEARLLDMRLSLWTLNKHVELREPLEELLEAVRNALGKEHVLAVAAQMVYGDTFRLNDEYDEADKYYQRALKTIRTNFVEGHPLAAVCLRSLIDMYLTRQNVELSRQYLSELRTLANSLYAACLEQETFAYLSAYEAKLLLLELVLGVPPPTEEAVVAEGEAAVPAPAPAAEGDAEAPAKAETATDADAEADADADAADATATPSAEAKETTPDDDNVNEPPSAAPEAATAAADATADDAASSVDDGGAPTQVEGDPDVDGVDKEMQLPPFSNEAYQTILEKIDTALERFEAMFSSVRLPPRSIHEDSAAIVAPLPSNKAMWMLGHPFVTYLRGLRGQVQLVEYVALQEYIRSLTAAQREHYYNVQAARQAKGKRMVPGKVMNPLETQQLPDPEGKQVMTCALRYLQDEWGLPTTFPLVIELDHALRDLQLQYDAMEIAHFLFQRGKALKGRGRFVEADKLFDESFGMFYQCFGPVQSAQSLIMAEILYEKAETARYLAKKVDFITSMHLLSMRMYRANHGQEITDEFILRNLLQMTQLLMDQHLYDDALSTYRQFEATFVGVYGADVTAAVATATAAATASTQPVGGSTGGGDLVDHRSRFGLLVQIKSSIATCLMKLHRYDEAMKVSAEALDLVKAISVATTSSAAATDEASSTWSTFTLAYLLIQIYLNDMQVMDALGNFDGSEQMYRLIETIFQSWEQQQSQPSQPQQPVDSLTSPESIHFADYSLLKATALQLRAEHFFKIHRVHEATKCASQAYTLRNALLNRFGSGSADAPAGSTAAGAGGKKPTTSMDRANKERDEEIRLNFMNAMDALVTAGLKQARENNAAAAATATAAAKSTLKNGGGKVTDAEREQNEEAALEDEINVAMKDVQRGFQADAASTADDTTSYGATMTTASEPPAAAAVAVDGDANDAANDGGGGGGGGPAIAQFSVLDFIGQPERAYQWQGDKISGHCLIAESLLFEARLAMFLGQIARAKEALEVAQTMLTALYVKPSLFKLDIQFAYADLRILQNQLEDSKKLHLQLLERRLSLVANRADHCLEVSESLYALAKLYLLHCQYDDAMQYINDALKIERRCWSPFWKKADGHYRIQSMMITCAGILTGKGFYTDAQGILTATIAALKGIVGDLHLDVAAAMAQKGHNACTLGLYEEALSTLQQAKSIAMVIVGDSHYFMGILHTYVSQTLRYTGKILEAKEQLDLAIVAIRSQLGKYHYLTVFTLLDIGLNFLDLGKYVTCQHVLNRALHLLKKSLGKDHIAVAYALYALGALHVAMGLVDVVNEFYEQALYVIRKVVGSDRFPLVALIMASQCELAGMKGHYDQAVQGMDDAIALMKLIYDTGNHYFIARATIALARILLQQGKFHDAKVMFDRAFVTMKQTYPRDHPLLFEAQLGGADCLLLLGRVEQAKALFERCLNGFKDWKGSTHPSIAMVLNRLGDMFTTLSRYEAAESVLLEAWGIRMRALREVNENHPEIAENLVSLSILLRQRGTIGLTKEEVQRLADLENPKKAKANAAAAAKKKKKAAGSDEAGDGGLDALLLDDALLFGDVLDDHKAAKKAKAAAKAAAAAAAAGDGEGGDEGGGDGGEEIVVVRGNDHDEDEEDEDDGASMPSIQISAIEKLDADQPAAEAAVARLDAVPESTGGDGASTVPPPATLDATALKEDTKLYAAIPLLEKAQRHLLAYYHDDEHHPSILAIHYHLAECAKMRGLFEEALAQHEAVFNLRRKVLGDQHLDTLLSLVGVLDVLRLTKRVFPPGKGAGGFFANSAPNNSDAAQLAAAKSAGQVTLVDHLASLTLPIAPPSSSSAAKRRGGGREDPSPAEEEGFIAEDATLKQLNKLKRGIASPTIAQNWRFISKMIDPSMLPPDQQPNKKKKPLPLPRGYMGYQFPAMKQNDQHQRSTTGGSLLDATAADGGAGAKEHVYNPLHDAKKVTELCTQLFRKLFAPEYEALGLKKKDDHYDHPIMALVLFCKAEMYRLRADGSLAMKYLEQALAMRRRLFRTHHPLIADCLVAIAELLRADQRYAQALPIYDKALEIRRETYPKEDHPCIAEVYSALALVAIGQGRYLVARTYLDQAKAICDGQLGAMHPALALIHNNYAILLQGQGQLREAMQSYRRALSIKQKVFGSAHPETAATMNNMGLLLKAQGRLDAAATVFQKTLEIQRKVFGQRHPDVATTENNLAAILSQQEGQKFAAKELLKASLITRMEIYGAEHAVVASTMNNLAVLLFTLGEIGQAKEYFEEALKTRRKLLGEDHPAVGEVQHNLGYWYYAQGYLVEAKRCYEDAIRIRRKTFMAPVSEGGTAATAAIDGAAAAAGAAAATGPVTVEETAQQRRAKSLAVAVTALHLSGVCEQAGDLTRALEYIEEAYQIRFELLGELHQETLLCQKSRSYIQHRLEAQQATNKPRSSTGGPRAAASTGATPAATATAAAVKAPPPSHLGFETGLGQQSVSVGEERQLF